MAPRLRHRISSAAQPQSSGSSAGGGIGKAIVFLRLHLKRDEAQGGETVENKSRSDILGKDTMAGVKGQTKGEETECDTKASADVCTFP